MVHAPIHEAPQIRGRGGRSDTTVHTLEGQWAVGRGGSWGLSCGEGTLSAAAALDLGPSRAGEGQMGTLSEP